MEAGATIDEIFCPFSNVPKYQLIDIGPSGAEQSNNISCSVVPRTLAKYLYMALLIQ